LLIAGAVLAVGGVLLIRGALRQHGSSAMTA